MPRQLPVVLCVSHITVTDQQSYRIRAVSKHRGVQYIPRMGSAERSERRVLLDQITTSHIHTCHGIWRIRLQQRHQMGNQCSDQLHYTGSANYIYNICNRKLK